MASGLADLHSLGITHRDIKLENIILDSELRWKLCDLGSSTHQTFNKEMTQQERQALIEDLSEITTPLYRAPELIDSFKKEQLSEKVDVWALGCVMYTLMFHKPPFPEGNRLAQINASFTLPSYPVYSPNVVNLMKSMLKALPSERPSAAQIRDRAHQISRRQIHSIM